MNQGPPSPTLSSQLLTPAGLAWVMNVSDRTVCEWTGGRRRKPQIACFKKGRVIRFTPEAVLHFIMVHTVLPARKDPALPPGTVPKIPQEQFELLCQRIERLVQACSAKPGAEVLQPEPEPKEAA